MMLGLKWCTCLYSEVKIKGDKTLMPKYIAINLHETRPSIYSLTNMYPYSGRYSFERRGAGGGGGGGAGYC